MSNFPTGNAVKLPFIRKYVGMASNLNNTECLLCYGSNTYGRYMTQNDIAPNFSIFYEMKVPDWSANSFAFGISTQLQSFYFVFPNSNLLQLCDMYKSPLISYTLNSNCLLSNNVFNSFKLVNMGSNLITTINGYCFPNVPVPNNWLATLVGWKDTTFSFTACNTGAVTGSNSIRRLHAQSLTTFTDPCVFVNSVTVEQVVNAAKVGATELNSRIVDTNCLFSDWAFTSNVYCMSNLVGSNATFSNAVVQSFTCSNFSASNVIGSSAAYPSVSSSNITCSNIGIRTSVNPSYVLDTNGQTFLRSNTQVFPTTFTNTSVLNSTSLSVNITTPSGTTQLNDPIGALLLTRTGASSQSWNQACRFALCRYENAGSGNYGSRTRMDLDLTHDVNDVMYNVASIRSDGRVGIGNQAPAYNLDVSGTGRFTSDLSVNGNLYMTGSSSMWLSNNSLFLRGGGDLNHSISYDSVVNGAAVTGFAGGSLNTTVGGFLTRVLYWNLSLIHI